MRFSTTWLVFSIQALTGAVAQSIGRYVHAEGRKYRLAFDVFSDKTVGLIFDTPTKHFIDGYYPLTHQGGGTYAVNFNGTFEGVHHWYMGIRSVYPDIVIRNGDLTTLTYTTGDTLYVMLGGKRVDLIRQGHTLQAGRFVYKLGEFPFPTLHISYTVYSNGELDVQFICTDIASPTVLFTLTEDEKSLKYKSYKLAPLHNVEKLKRDIRLACPGTPVSPGDLTNVVFADELTIFIVLSGRRYVLSKI